MPTKVQIDGLGTVELDDGFSKLTPAQQDATIQEIASHRSRPQAPQAAPEPEGYTGPPIMKDSDFHPDEAPPQAPVAEAQDDQAPEAPQGGPGFATRQLGALNEGIASTLGLPVDGANWLLSKVGLGSEKPVLGSKFISDTMHKLGIGQADASYAPRSALETYTQAASKGVGASVMPFLGIESAGARLAAKTIPEFADVAPTLASAAKSGFKNLAKEAFARPGLAAAAEALSGAGSGIGAQAGHDLSGGNPYAEMAGSLIGGVGGGLLTGPVSQAVRSPTTRFVENQVAKNPYAAFDAEIAGDLKGITTDTAVSPLDPKGRAAVTAKSINNLEQGYQSRFKDMLNGLDLPKSEKLKLKGALDQRYTLTQPEIDGLRGSTQGDAVADAITKIQRLRALTPELKKGGLANFLKTPIELASMAIGSTAGPAGAPAGYGLARYILRRAGDAEAARVNAADSVIKRSKAYEALGARTGPSGAIESKQALNDLFAESGADGASPSSRPTKFDRQMFRMDITNPEDAAGDLIATRAKQSFRAARQAIDSAPTALERFQAKLDAPPADAPITPLDRKSFLNQISNPEVDPRDLTAVTSDSNLVSRVRSRDRAIAKMGRKLDRFDAAAPEAPAKEPTARQKALADKAMEKLQQDQDVERLNQSAFADNIVPEGGFHRETYNRTGLKPADQLAGVNKMVADGLISEKTATTFLNSPRKLKASGAAYRIQDRLRSMADDGSLPRDPQWSAPKPEAASATEGETTNIRNPIAYEATARANQGRVSSALSMVHGDEGLPDAVKQTIGEAIAKMGNTSNADAADQLVSATRQAVPEKYRDYAARVLSPLAQQIRE